MWFFRTKKIIIENNFFFFVQIIEIIFFLNIYKIYHFKTYLVKKRRCSIISFICTLYLNLIILYLYPIEYISYHTFIGLDLGFDRHNYYTLAFFNKKKYFIKLYNLKIYYKSCYIYKIFYILPKNIYIEKLI